MVCNLPESRIGGIPEELVGVRWRNLSWDQTPVLNPCWLRTFPFAVHIAVTMHDFLTAFIGKQLQNIHLFGAQALLPWQECLCHKNLLSMPELKTITTNIRETNLLKKMNVGNLTKLSPLRPRV